MQSSLHLTKYIRPSSRNRLSFFISDLYLPAGGYKVPKGQDMIVSVYNIHRNPDVWEDPEAFLPERFPLADPIPNEQNTNFRSGPCRPVGFHLLSCFKESPFPKRLIFYRSEARQSVWTPSDLIPCLYLEILKSLGQKFKSVRWLTSRESSGLFISHPGYNVQDDLWLLIVSCCQNLK